MKNFNINQIVSIETKDFVLSQKYKYFPEVVKKNIWGKSVVKIKDGVYNMSKIVNYYRDIYEFICQPQLFNNTILNKKYFMNDEKEIFAKPSNSFTFSNGKFFIKFYDTLEEAVNDKTRIKLLGGSRWLEDEDE
jgi:hypothetical protein